MSIKAVRSDPPSILAITKANMEVVRGPFPTIKLPPPTIVTEPPPMSPLAKESTNKNQLMRNNNSMLASSGITSALSSTRGSFFPQSCPMSPSMKPKHALTTPGLTLGLQVTKPQSPVLRRSQSEPMGKKSQRRVNLGPGCGMLDWIRLCKNTKNMSGTGGEVLTVTEEELARHCTAADAWTCIRGKVYNITPYFKFHPGGKDDLLQAAGKDCTILFDEVHKWVNYASMLKKCFVGNMAEESPQTRRNRSDSLIVPKQLLVVDGMNRQAVSKTLSDPSESSDEALVHSPQSPVHPPIQFIDETDSPAIVVDPPSPIRKNSDASRPVVTLWDWNQTDETISIQVFIHNQNVKESDIVVDAVGQTFEASIKLDSWIYQMEIALLKQVKNPKVTIHSNKVDIRLTKLDSGLKWQSIGTLLPSHNQMVSESNKVTKFRSCTISSVTSITHDTRLYTLETPLSCVMTVPVGHHVSIRPNEQGNELERSYTPIRSLSPSSSQSNTIELLIKLYKDGAMSQHLAKLSPGDQLRVSDPQGTFDASRLDGVSDVLLLAAGTGFTPMVQVLNQLLGPKIQTDTSKLSLNTTAGNTNERKVHLLFANKTTKDIIWQKELDTLVQNHKNFSVTHILSAPEATWQGKTGRVTMDTVKLHLPPLPSPSDGDRKKPLVCICGPLPFTESMTDALVDADYPEQCIHVFQ